MLPADPGECRPAGSHRSVQRSGLAPGSPVTPIVSETLAALPLAALPPAACMLPQAVTVAAQAAAIRRDRAPARARSMFVIMPLSTRARAAWFRRPLRHVTLGS